MVVFVKIKSHRNTQICSTKNLPNTHRIRCDVPSTLKHLKWGTSLQFCSGVCERGWVHCKLSKETQMLSVKRKKMSLTRIKRVIMMCFQVNKAFFEIDSINKHLFPLENFSLFQKLYEHKDSMLKALRVIKIQTVLQRLWELSVILFCITYSTKAFFIYYSYPILILSMLSQTFQ